ncbi:MAG: hypothetical protein IT378_17230 [Sandaracinaceae bacterium]|nr:hypothetical protein [Sandaracinaceae bacterium]
MEWIAHDEVDPAELPAWAQGEGERLDGDPYQVRVRPEGLVLLRGRTATALRWGEILVPIRLDDPRRLLLAASRRPPRLPWLELAGHDVAAIERAVRLGLEADHGGYRGTRPQREALSPDQVLTAVLEHQAIPGGVEIPASVGGSIRNTLVGAAAGAGIAGYGGLLFGPAGIAIGAAAGAAVVAGLVAGREILRRRRAGRVLVLTPDCFVGGLDGRSVQAIPWFRVGRFCEGIEDRGGAALEVWTRDQILASRVSARYFGQPLDVIVAVAEAYRQRATRA